MAEQNFETLILRFRDLVTENNQTINNHKEIIELGEYVWWAWWKKGHEFPPINEFGGLGAKAKEKSIIIYLVDSGQNKVYKAECNGI